MSFRYYDPIIQLVQLKLSLQRREFFKIKKQLAIAFKKNLSIEAHIKKLIQSVDFQTSLKNVSGSGPKIVSGKNIDLITAGEINHNQSMHIN